LLRRLQTEGVIHKVLTRVGHEAWLVTGFNEVRQLLDDERLGRSHPDPARAARMGDSALFGGPLGAYDTEAADSARLRALLQPQFSPKRMRAFRPRVEALTTALLDDLAGRTPPADLNQALALPLPILVICELLGVPYSDRDRFRGWTNAAGDVTDRRVSERGLADLFTYGRQLVARKRALPDDDFISRLCAEGVDDQRVARLAMMMLFAGHETTLVAIGFGVLSLLTNPGQRQVLLAEPELIPGAVEEMLRIQQKGGGGGIPRYAKIEMQIGDATISPGDLVLLDIGAANHDLSTFADADHFNVKRAISQHLGFGYGAHYCLGAPLARIELQTVFTQLLARFPTMQLAAPVQTLRVQSNKLTGGLIELPVTW
jgi:pentalenolactone synthase